MMKVCIQLQPASSLNTEQIEWVLKKIGIRALREDRNDDGVYTNLTFETRDIINLWPTLKSELMICSGFADSAIVVCEGDNSWDDYLLLYHMDPNEKLDEV